MAANENMSAPASRAIQSESKNSPLHETAMQSNEIPIIYPTSYIELSPPPQPIPNTYEKSEGGEQKQKKELTMFEKFFAPKYANTSKKNLGNNKEKNLPVHTSTDNHFHNRQITDHSTWILPEGWTTVQHKRDGRIYYFHAESGLTRWTHPNAPFSNPDIDDKCDFDDHDNNSSTTIKQKFVRFAQPFLPSSMRRKKRYLSNNNNDHSGNYQYYDDNTKDTNQFVNDRNNPFTNNNMNPFIPWWKRPDSHQCYACISLILCPIPMGICAFYHSSRVNQTWSEGNYGGSLDHSRQAYNYACWGTTLAVGIWIWWLFFRDGNVHLNWPDWNFDR